jgi:predicted  nucleic acid-binding Zn-ribbon protein
MAWFINHYSCAACGHKWSDGWSCMCDDDCPHCGARHMSPVDSDDLTEIIVPRGDCLALLRSPPTAGHNPDYQKVAEIAMPPEIVQFWTPPPVEYPD